MYMDFPQNIFFNIFTLCFILDFQNFYNTIKKYFYNTIKKYLMPHIYNK